MSEIKMTVQYNMLCGCTYEKHELFFHKTERALCCPIHRKFVDTRVSQCTHPGCDNLMTIGRKGHPKKYCDVHYAETQLSGRQRRNAKRAAERKAARKKAREEKQRLEEDTDFSIPRDMDDTRTDCKYRMGKCFERITKGKRPKTFPCKKCKDYSQQAFNVDIMDSTYRNGEKARVYA